jgi:hypothetical protein
LCKRRLDVDLPLARRKCGLWWPVASPAEHAPHRSLEVQRQVVGLVESPVQQPPWVERHGDNGVRSIEDGLPG